MCSSCCSNMLHARFIPALAGVAKSISNHEEMILQQKATSLVLSPAHISCQGHMSMLQSEPGLFRVKADCWRHQCWLPNFRTCLALNKQTQKHIPLPKFLEFSFLFQQKLSLIELELPDSQLANCHRSRDPKYSFHTSLTHACSHFRNH